MTSDQAVYEGSVIDNVIDSEDGRKIIILDKTIFYPQGGGQAYDQGEITGDDFLFEVEEVRFIDGLVYHLGKITKGEVKIGSEVTLKIDSNRRDLNSKLQSAGHLIDIALRNIGYKEVIPGKGYHFPDSPYVEYIGQINGEDLADKLHVEIDQLIATGYKVKARLTTIDDAKKVCYFFPEYIPEGKPVRVVSVWNDEYIPCGGTHVKDISELKGLKIRNIKSKKGNTRVSYQID